MKPMPQKTLEIVSRLRNGKHVSLSSDNLPDSEKINRNKVKNQTSIYNNTQDFMGQLVWGNVKRNYSTLCCIFCINISHDVLTTKMKKATGRCISHKSKYLNLCEQSRFSVSKNCIRAGIMQSMLLGSYLLLSHVVTVIVFIYERSLNVNREITIS